MALFTLLIWLPGVLMAQRPTHVPFDSEPVRFFESPFSVIIYVVIPLLILLFYVIWRRRIKKEQKEQEKNK